MFNVGPVRTSRDPVAIQKQLKAFGGADMNADWRGGGLKLPAKAQQYRLTPPAGKEVAMRRRHGISKIRMPDPRRLVNGLEGGNPGIAKMQSRRQENFVDDRRFVIRRGGGKGQGDGHESGTQYHRHIR